MQILQRNLYFLFVLLVSITMMGSVAAKYEDDNGKHHLQKHSKVGYMQMTDVQLSTGATTVTIWYPARKHNPKGTREPYDSNIVGFVDAGPTVIGIKVPSPMGALRNAKIAKGKFPLIVVDHGGGNEPDGHMFGGAQTNEILAKTGYVVVGYSRVAPSCDLRPVDLHALINYMVDDSPVKKSIKKNKVGVVGESASGKVALAIAGGDAGGFVRDDRVKAIILDEPSIGCTPAQPNIAGVPVPVMIFDGSEFPGLGDQTQLFNDLVSAKPRYKVTMNMPSHLGFSTGQCMLAEGARHASLQFQLDNGVMPQDLLEPLDISYNGIAVSTNDAAGEYLSFYWNFAEIINFPIGSNGHFCTRVGVDDPILSTDQDNDGFTDMPPLLPKALVTLSNDELIKSYQKLQQAFWDLHLKGKKHAAKILKKKRVEKDPNVNVFMSEGVHKKH